LNSHGSLWFALQLEIKLYNLNYTPLSWTIATGVQGWLDGKTGKRQQLTPVKLLH